MRVDVRQRGSPPAITTPARANAFAGAKVLADLLAAHEFADMCILTIDYIGDGFTPVLGIDTVKFLIRPAGYRLEHHWQISLEDAFGQENFDNSVARTIVDMLKAEFEEKIRTGPPLVH